MCDDDGRTSVMPPSLPSLKSCLSCGVIGSGEEEKDCDSVRSGKRTGTGRDRRGSSIQAPRITRIRGVWHGKIAAGIGPGCILPLVTEQGSNHFLGRTAIQHVSVAVLRNGRAPYFQGLRVRGMIRR